MRLVDIVNRLRSPTQRMKKDRPDLHSSLEINTESEIKMKQLRRFEGKVALITGGGSGLGKAAALRLTQEGAAVVVAGRTSKRLAMVRKEIETMGGRALDIQTDVSSEVECKRMVEQTIDEFGKLDILFASAGIHGGGGSVVDTPVELWDRVMDIDLKGAYLPSKFAVPVMQKAGGGSILFVSSIGGLSGSIGAPAFQAAKGGLINLTRNMAVTHATENIRVNCICPGVILTPLTEKWLSNPVTYKFVCSWHPMNRIGSPEEVAAAVAFLVSDEASFITGAILPIDGGYLAAGRDSVRRQLKNMVSFDF